MTANTILVIGSTGKTGRRVVDRLKARQVPVRSGSRSGMPPFDWENQATWAPALEGVKAVYVAYYPDLSVPSAPRAIQSLTRLAAKSGVKRLVLLSGRGEPEAQHCEEIVQASSIEWNLLVASWFAQNFSEGHFLDPILAGEVALPAADVGEPFVDADDIAEVAVAALTEDRHVGQRYELTGPQLLTFPQAIAEIARAAKREIPFTRITVDEYADALKQAQLPDDAIEMVKYLFTEVLDGRNASVKDGVTRALGRAPRSFSDYARDAARSGVWNGRHGS